MSMRTVKLAAFISLIWLIPFGSVYALDLKKYSEQQLYSITENVETLQSSQRIAVAKAKESVDDAATAAETKEAILRLERSKKDLELLVETEKSLKLGNQPPPESLRVIEEIISWVGRKVWVICQGKPWMNEKAKLDYGPIIDKHLSQVRLNAFATGRVTTFDRLRDNQVRLRENVGSAVAIGPNRIVTNKHVILSSRIGYENVAGGGEIQLHSNIVGRIAFPVEYERCDPGALGVQSVVDIIEIEFSHPTLDFVVAKVNGVMKNFIKFPDQQDHVVGDRVAVIGYTSRPGDGETFLSPVQIDDVFRAPDGRTPFPVQRLAEGFLIDNDGIESGYFRYDATTWGGNSGSIVMDLTTGSVLGLHARGLQSKDQGTGYNEAISSKFLAESISSLSQ